MTAQPGCIKSDLSILPTQLTCAICPGLELNICQAASQAQWADAGTDPIPLQQPPGFAPARRVICRDEDLQGAVPIICGGWVATIAILSDGSRQILSILLPGDLVSTTLLFEPRARYLVEAITDVHYRLFSRSELKALLLKRSDLFEKKSFKNLDRREAAGRPGDR